MSIRTIHGHQRVIQALDQAIHRERLHHTLLFSGPEGVGKRLIATELATTFFCQAEKTPKDFGGCKECHHCKLVQAGNMPDLIVLDCGDKTTTSTDGVRKILRDLRLRPFSGNFRFLVFDNVHLLQGQAANALLKSLEEPREGTYFVLITGKPHLMLRTIQSRAQRWGFHRLNSDELKQVVASGESMKVDDTLIALADGSFESYKLLYEHADLVKDLQRRLQEVRNGSKAQAFALGEELAKNKDQLRDTLLCIHLIARHCLTEEHELGWANFLNELGNIDYYLFRRNFAPQYILQTLFLHLASSFHESFLVEPQRSLDAIVV